MEYKGKIYISLPISGLDYDKVRIQAERMQRKVEKFGYTAVNPLHLNKQTDSYATCMGRCIKALLECEYILLAPQWWKSKGCQLEYKAAILNRIKTIQY